MSLEATLPLAAALALAAGCRSNEPVEAREAYWDGDLATAEELYRELAEDETDDAHLWELDRAMVVLAQGRLEDATRSLRSARERIRELRPYDHESWLGGGSSLQGFASMLGDDNALDYPGRDFEQLLLYSFLSILELVSGGLDEVAYSLEAQERLFSEFESYEDFQGENPKEAYLLPGVGEYVRASFLEEDPTRVGEALRSYERFLALVPDFPFAERDLARLRGETRRADDAGVVYVFTFVGRGPHLEETVLDSPTAAVVAFLQVLLGLAQDRATIPILSGIPVPRLVEPASGPTETHVFVGGGEAGVTAAVADVGRTARAELDAMWDTIVLRASLRRLVKAGAGEGVKAVVANQTSELGGQWWGLLIDVFTNVWAATESADLRAWDVLPASVQVLRLELPEGVHEVAVQPGRAGHPQGRAATVAVDVRRGYHQYVLGVFPDFSHVSPLLASHSVAVQP